METSKILKAFGIFAIVFGALTVYSGGRALFGGTEARVAVGNAVSFVLYFNFFAGFVYVLAGVGILMTKRWAARTAKVLALATGGVTFAFGLHVMFGGAFEARTVGALALRLGFWILVATMIRPWLVHTRADNMS